MTTGQESPLTINNSPMPTGQRADAPKGFEDFCRRNPTECRLPTAERFLRGIIDANMKAKSLVTPTPEEGDLWQTRFEPGPGDCEDFALTLRSILRAEFPAYSSAFLMATAHTENGQYHAVLSIETGHGTIVCDIRFPECMPWKHFPYTWRYREVAGADHWQEVGPLASGMTAETATASSGRR